MKRYILGLLVLTIVGINYTAAAELDSAIVTFSYTYTNDQASRNMKVVPMRLHPVADERSYTLTIEVHFYGDTRTGQEIVDDIVDRLNFDAFRELQIWREDEKVFRTYEFTLEGLRRAGSLKICYIPSENTIEAIKARRIRWILNELIGESKNTWEFWEKERLISDSVHKNYVDESGRTRSLEELRK